MGQRLFSYLFEQKKIPLHSILHLRNHLKIKRRCISKLYLNKHMFHKLRIQTREIRIKIFTTQWRSIQKRKHSLLLWKENVHRVTHLALSKLHDNFSNKRNGQYRMSHCISYVWLFGTYLLQRKSSVGLFMGGTCEWAQSVITKYTIKQLVLGFLKKCDNTAGIFPKRKEMPFCCEIRNEKTFFFQCKIWILYRLFYFSHTYGSNW